VTVVHAADEAGTCALVTFFPEWPYICGHDIPRDRDRCVCGARRAFIAVDYQPVLPFPGGGC
jgi:hypothetical protein